MTTISTNVIGANGVSPVQDTEELWRMWNINQIWQGGAAGTSTGKRYVPKVDDYVIDPDTYETWVVASIDAVTLIPVLATKLPYGMSTEFSSTDVLFGVGPGTQSDTYRAFLDTSVYPYTLSINRECMVAGTATSYCKIFRGGTAGTIVSKVYDNTGRYLTDKVALEKVALDNVENYAIKVVPTCNCTDAMIDGEIVTAVFYSDADTIVSKRQLLVENTSFIASLDGSVKYVTGITLNCPFLSTTEDYMIYMPLNVTLDSLNLIGVVHYSDGSSLELPVNGGKFKMYGLDQYVSTIVDQKIDLVLQYTLSEGEVAYGAVNANGKLIKEAYTLKTINTNTSYTVKLFGYPVWQDKASGYKMVWHLMNLDRTLCLDVTDHVEFAENTGAFNPKGYGYLQQKSVLVNLRKVSSIFKPVVHTQMVDIVLLRAPDARLTPWQMSNESVSERPVFGDQLFCIRQAPAYSTVKLDSGLGDQATWLKRFFHQTYPLMDSTKETAVPTPTHFYLTQGSHSQLFTLDNWNQVLNLTWIPEVNSTIFIKFIKYKAGTEIQLSLAAVLVTN